MENIYKGEHIIVAREVFAEARGYRDANERKLTRVLAKVFCATFNKSNRIARAINRTAEKMYFKTYRA